MAGLQQHFIAGIRAETDVQYALVGRGGIRWDNLHLPQSMLDSSCGLLSFLQAAMVLCQIPRSQTERLTSTSRKPLRKLWELAKEHYFEGTGPEEIEAYTATFAPVLTCATVLRPGIHRLGVAASEAIRNGGIPLLRFDSRRFSHWATVVGFESAGDESKPTALLMLDPASPAPWSGFANARLSLNNLANEAVRTSPPYTMPYRYLDGECCAVKPRSLVIVSRAQPP